MLGFVIQGSKFTIGIGLVIVIIRILLSFLLSAFLSTYLSKLIPFIKWIAEPFSIIPQTLLVYFLLVSVLWMPMEGFHHPFWLRTTFQVIVMSLIALPSLTFHLSSLMKKSWDEEYVESSRVLGGSKFHILRKHIIPSVSDKVLLLFMQQFIQVLLLMPHLGILRLFFGGNQCRLWQRHSQLDFQ